MIDLTFWRIKRKVKRHFKFLYEVGFTVYSSKYQPEHMGYWEINLYSKDLLVQIYDDRGSIGVLLDSNRNQHQWHALETVVFFITSGQEFVGSYKGNLSDVDGQMQRLASVFQKHFNKILFVFGDNYENHIEELSKVYNTVLDLTLEDYGKSHPKEDFLKYVPKRK